MHNYAEIIHRDIKPENLLVGEDDVLRISDFGISKIMEEGDDKLENNAGTQYYQPPEAWEGIVYYFLTKVFMGNREKFPWKTH